MRRAPTLPIELNELISKTETPENDFKGLESKHFLYSFENFGFYHGISNFERPSYSVISDEKLASVNKSLSVHNRIPLYVVLNISRLYNINIIDECFEFRLFMYLLWPIDFEESGINQFIEDNFGIGGGGFKNYISLSSEQIESLGEITFIPKLKILNAIEVEETIEPVGIRLYPKNGGLILWNKGYRVVTQKNYNVSNFPFDTQDLAIEFINDDPLTSHIFQLHIISIQFYKEAIEMSEWHLQQPTVHHHPSLYDGPSFAIATLHIVRKYHFYIHNVIGMMTLLSFINFVIYSFPIEDYADRIQITLTLMLTAVAFKFAVGEAIPKVPYHTFLDKFVLLVMVEFGVTTMISPLPQLMVNSQLLDENIAIWLDRYFFFFVCALSMFPKLSWSLQAMKKIRQNRNVLTNFKVPSYFYQFRFASAYFLPPLNSTTTTTSFTTTNDNNDAASPSDLCSLESLPAALSLTWSLCQIITVLKLIFTFQYSITPSSSSSTYFLSIYSFYTIIKYIIFTTISGIFLTLFLFTLYHFPIFRSITICILILLITLLLWFFLCFHLLNSSDIYSLSVGIIEHFSAINKSNEYNNSEAVDSDLNDRASISPRNTSNNNNNNNSNNNNDNKAGVSMTSAVANTSIKNDREVENVVINKKKRKKKKNGKH